MDEDARGYPLRKFDALLPVTSAVAMALLAGGCSSAQTANRDVAICRDAAGQRIDDSNCARHHAGGGGMVAGAAAWYFLGRGARVPAIGERVSGGSPFMRAGASYARASAATVSRGGFGFSARAGG